MTSRPALQALTPNALALLLPGLDAPETRKIVSAMHRDGSIFNPIAGVRRLALDAVRAHCAFPSLRVVVARKSAFDPFVKLLLETPSQDRIETIRIPLERPGRISVCVSSQVGCALACSFCATGRLGLQRNLETWEIIDQVRAVRRLLEPGERLHGVVFQGMGEPLANLDRVLDAIAVLTDPCAQAVDARKVTVCTSGIPSGIHRLAQEAPKVRLAVSLGSARPDLRRRLMPISERFSLDQVLDATAAHARTTGLAPLWAVTLLSEVNDTDDDALALAQAATRFAEAAGVRPRISIIPYNATGAPDPFTRSSADREERFRDQLRLHGFASHKRYSGGADVGAACGQLIAQA